MPLFPPRRAAHAFCLASLVLLCAAPLAPASAQGSTQSAVWVPRKLSFTYQGFTTHYSCDGLRDKMRSILLELGARRQDLDVRSANCTRLVGPEPFPGVEAKFYVLVPASEASTPRPPQTPAPGSEPPTAPNPPGTAAPNASGPTTAAHWQTVDLQSASDPLSQSGGCELLEQVKRQVLKLFTTRDIRYDDNCFPHTLLAGGTSIKLQVLKPLPTATSATVPPSASTAAPLRR